MIGIMPEKIKAYAAEAAHAPLKLTEIDLGPLGADQVEIAVRYCGLCHSDLSMLNNDWGMTSFPFVPGHEVIGEVVAAGPSVHGVQVGDTVGLGWSSNSCMACPQCLSGNHNLCATGEGTIVGRPGGFAERVRCHGTWATKLPNGLSLADAGPLFCGGATVFNPIVEFNVKPTDRVGVVGVGGLGHMALKFLNKWGSDVTAFTSSPSKAEEARSFGAHQIIDSRSDAEMKSHNGTFDFILVTANVPLNWMGYLDLLAPKGRLHFVGAVPEPVSFAVFPLITGQKQISASPVGSPATIAKMLNFCARHDILPTTEHFPMSSINEAFEHLAAGKARYRIVLDNDIA